MSHPTELLRASGGGCGDAVIRVGGAATGRELGEADRELAAVLGAVLVRAARGRGSAGEADGAAGADERGEAGYRRWRGVRRRSLAEPFPGRAMTGG